MLLKMDCQRGIKVNDTDSALLKGTKESLNKTVDKLKSTWKSSVFAKCFPSLATNHESSLEAIRSSVLERLVEALCISLSSIVEEELAEPLNNLSGLIKKCSTPQNFRAWRPSGSPEQDMITPDSKFLRYEKQKLLETLALHHKKKLELFERVKEGRNKCHRKHLEIVKQKNLLQSRQALYKTITSPETEFSIERVFFNDCADIHSHKEENTPS